MYKNIKIGILGGDMRQAVLARRLSSLGFEVAVWGLGKSCDIGESVRCTHYLDAIRGADALILPLPVSRDGVTLNCPLWKGESPRLSEIITSTEADTVLLGGKLDSAFTSAATKKQITLIDYFECEELQIKNAVPTAEGAVAIALDELPITIFGAKTAVTGYGRVGKAVAKLLKVMGADVRVAARSGEQLAYAEVDGCTPMSIKKTAQNREPLTSLSDCDVIFNTVPYIIFTKDVLASLRKDTLIIDLAGDDGGVDRAAAEKLGIKTVWALSLPGKVAPFTAASIICDCVLELLREKGVIKPK
ncbi:MAG: dipicolinate synthase subunit DpsA [Clostridia bacterium]|nr:dipicolinate synthase subunit DpsA [Clostridia bacterium]